MIEYVNVHVDYCFKGYLIGTINKIGLKINVPKNISIQADEDVKLYLKIVVNLGLKNNFTYDIYGFKDYKERNLFNELVQINGVGPKTAISIIEFGIDNITTCIEKNDFDELKKVIKINTKQMNAIAAYLTYKFDLQPKIQKIEEQYNDKNSEIAKQTAATLLALGYSKTTIDLIMKKIDFKTLSDVSDAVNLAIRLMN